MPACRRPCTNERYGVPSTEYGVRIGCRGPREAHPIIAMYERFTDRARKVMQLANQEAQRFNHEYIGTEHVLLGLIKEGSGVAAQVLKNLDVNVRTIRLEVEKLVQSGPDMVTMGKLPTTPRAKSVIGHAMKEAHSLNHNYVGTEHLLLGLLREPEGVAAQVLMNCGLKLQDVREEILSILGHGFEKGDLFRDSPPHVQRQIMGSGNAGRLFQRYRGRPIALAWLLLFVFYIRALVALLWALPVAGLIGWYFDSWTMFSVALALIALQNLIRFTIRFGWFSPDW